MEFQNLPAEIIVKIFKYDCQWHICSALSSVCRKFNKICQSYILWCEIKTCHVPLHMSSEFWGNLLQMDVFRHIKVLKIDNFREIFDIQESFATKTIPVFQSLNYLDVGTVYSLNDEPIPNILCPSLQTFKFNCKRQQNMEEEMEFSLTWHIQLDSKADDEIWTNTNYLSHIWVAMLEFLCIVYEADPEYKEIKCLNHIKFFAEIKRFESKRMFCENLDFNIGKGVENILNLFINQTGKDEIYTGLKWLTDLNISQAEISDNDFKTIVSCCKSLSSLSICGCPSITDFGIEHVASMLPQLHTLNVSKASNDCGGNITDYGLETLVKGCPLLTNLNICKCTNVGDFGIFSIATHCHKLTNLDASGCVRVTDESIEALSRKCNNLQILNLDCCVQVSHKSLVHILFNCSKLHKASFENCYKISDEGFKNYSLEIHKLFIKKKMDVLHATRSNVDAFHSHIQKINLSFCSQIGDSFVRELVRLCPDLQSISFCGCYRISDDTVNFTLEHCGGLRYLDISGGSIMQASKLTDASLNHIARQGQNLEVLLMIKNENISVSELMQMIESCFSLKQLQLTCSKSRYESLLKAVSLCSRHVTLDMPEIGGLNPKKRYRCTINIGEFVKSNSTDDLNLQYS